jgi:transglutaminase-like putative cysteine protease
MNKYLQASPIVDWKHPVVLGCAQQIALDQQPQPTLAAPPSRGDSRVALKASPTESLARACFEWVRDQIHHSVDHQMNPVTCCASDVLKHKTGYCFAKSHLLAALLRANNIPAGFCYQRLSLNDQGAPYSLHGFNAVYLEAFGWYRIDPRGNRDGIDARFTPPQEQLAYTATLPGEVDFLGILAEPLPMVIEALETYPQWDQVWHHLPDLSPADGNKYGLKPVLDQQDQQDRYNRH